MQITKVSFMNFNGGRKVAPKDLKKAENLIQQEKKASAFFPETALTGNIDNKADNSYIQQYAENRKVMQELKREQERNIAENYFGPFSPISSNTIKK